MREANSTHGGGASWGTERIRDEIRPEQKAGTLGSQGANGRILGDFDFQEKPAKEPGNQKFSKRRGTQETASQKPWQREWAAPLSIPGKTRPQD